MVTSKELSSDFAKDIAVKYVDLVRTYLINLNLQKYRLDRETAIISLEELKLRVMGKSTPLTHYRQSDTLWILAVQQIILNQKNISPKLRSFWLSHNEMADLAVSQNKKFQPQQFFDKHHEKINDVDKRYQDLVKIISKDKTDDVKRAYSVFYIHILKTEMIEFSFLRQFKKILKEFNLTQKYDPEDIFSVTNKVRKGNEWRTDARAIRDALSHNKYTLDVNGSSWNIIFDNHDEGYDFNKTFTNSQFYKYMNDTDLIYRGTMMLLRSFASMILIKQHCIEE